MIARNRMHGLVKALKIVGWTLLAIVVVMSALLFCAVKFIESKRLAPMVEEIANDYIDGHVSLGGLKLGFHPRFPILGVELEDLTVISHAFDSLSSEQRGLIPNYADSLLTLDYMSGSLDIKRLLIDNELALRDVVLRGLSVNLVIAHNGKANYEVISIPANTVDNSKGRIPSFRINRFALEQPKEIRFYNAADSTSASVLLLTDAALDGDNQPTYRLKISGNVSSPKATLATNLEQIDFGINGNVKWDPENPGLIVMDEVELRGAFIKGSVSGELDFQDSPIIRKAKVDLKPLAISDLLTLLPDSLREEYRLKEPYFSTDAAVTARFELMKPMNLTTDTIPSARLGITIPPSALKYGKTRIDTLAMDVEINTVANSPDLTVLQINRLIASGEATNLSLSAIISNLMSDPSFDTDVSGRVDLADLPLPVRGKIPGYLSGIISADLKATGSLSMFDRKRFHHLVADGIVTGNNLYFLSSDTSKMVEIGKARIGLSSNRLVGDIPLVNLNLDVDTATILVSGVDLALGSIRLSAVPDSKQSRRHVFMADTTRMMPYTGDLNVGRFNIISITDSAGARIRNIRGNVNVQESARKGSLPELSTSLLIGTVSAGSLSDRVLVNDTKVKATLYKLASVSGKKSKPEKKTAEFREYSYIAPKDVYKYVYYKRKHGRHIKRVYTAADSDDDEMLVWNLTRQFSGFLKEWRLSGSVNTTHARLLTPLFPLITQISDVNLRFNNDTVDIARIALRAGNSDISMSGLISNVRKALTSGSDNNLKGNFSIISDTIDVNELSASAFTGASYAADKRHGKVKGFGVYDDAALQIRLDALSKKGPGRSSSILIPVNVDANLNIKANHMLYSDLDMQGVGGDVLVYDGGVNLHDLTASSDFGKLTVSALYSAPKANDMSFGFGMNLVDFDIARFVRLVPAIDSITPLMHDFSGFIGAEIAATCRLDSGMNIALPSLDAAIRISGDNLSFIDPEKYRTLGKWLGFKDKADNTIHSLNVDMTVTDGILRVYPFAFNIDRYRLGVYGYNDINMNFDYHLSVLKSPIPFKFGITVKGNPKKYKVRFGGAKFNENTEIESVNIVNNARINLLDQIENVFKRGVRNSRFARLKIPAPAGFDMESESELSPSDSLMLIKEGLLEDTVPEEAAAGKEKKSKKKHKRFWIF